MLKKIIISLLNKAGYTIEKNNYLNITQDMEQEFIALYHECAPYTMVSTERLYAIYKAVEYIVKNNIEGDFVECGVWRGGCAMMMAKCLVKWKATNRKIYLYDTYEGMTLPTEKDVSYSGEKAKDTFNQLATGADSSAWCDASIEDVTQNLYATNYPKENLVFVKGKVEDTIPAQIPNKISLLRLDTDWFESTHHEMIHLYPILASKGVLLLDDYGHWQGAREAVDSYFKANSINMLLSRIDYTCRMGLKE